MLPRLRVLSRLLAVVFLATCALTCRAGQEPAHTVWFVPKLEVTDLGKGTAPVDGNWQFHLGDDLTWAATSFDDSLWDKLTTDKPWGTQNYDSYSGYAWYRRHIHVTAAPGISDNFSILIPAVDDVYEVYWNGQEIGRLGQMPPHWVWFSGQPAQVYNLGPVRSGVLAIRVWKSPLFSTDTGKNGGFEAVPLIGSPDAIAQVRGDLDYQWLRKQQFQFGLTSLYGVVALLGFVAWYRDRKEWLLFWTAFFAACLVLELFLNGLRLHVSTALLTCFAQVEIAFREMSMWFLLLWLLRLQDNRKLVVLTRKAALISVTAGTLDGLLILLYPWPFSEGAVQIADACLTPFIVFFELLPVMLVLYAFLRGKPLESPRWVVGAVAFANGMTYMAENVASQGVRFTHWTLADRITAPLFNFGDNPITLPLLLRTILFFSIVYAVIRYFFEHHRRTSALEQEYQSARELQRVLVPSSMPVVPGYTLTSAYKPAQEVGGDFFQIIPLESGSTLIVLGDVSGKGLMAAMAVSLIVGAVRALADDHPNPADLLTLLNRRLCGRLQGGFATCVILRIDQDSQCAVASAGHPAPFLNESELDLPGALPLGISPLVAYDEFHVSLKVGDHFSMYTDGLLEARNQSGELYSFGRLARLFATRPNAVQATQAAVNFGQDDDITVLTLTRLATPNDSFMRQTA